MAQENLLALAKQGDANAIAALINQTLQKQGVTARTKRQDSYLSVLLLSKQVPNQESCVRWIHDEMLKLETTAIQFIRIYGQKEGQNLPAWSQTIQLRHSPQATLEKKQSAVSISTEESKFSLSQRQYLVPVSIVGGISCLFLALGTMAFNAQFHSQQANQSEAATVVQVPQGSPLPNPPIANPVPTNQPLNTPSNNTVEQISVPDPLPPSTTGTLSIKAVGDIVPGTNFPNNRLHPKPESLFQAIQPYLQDADIVFGNFESTLTNHPRSSKNPNGKSVFAFRNPPSYAQLLKDVGFTVLSVANNHSFDFMNQGFEDTHRNINNAGMTAFGKKNEIVYLNVNNTPVAFIGFSTSNQHNSVNDLAAGRRLVQEANKKADIVVVSTHMGAEGTSALRTRNQTERFYGENRGNPVLFARTMIDNGADLVLGHGPHVPRAMELYKGKLVAYSLGNFLGYQTLSNRGDTGNSLILDAQLNKQGDFVSGKIIPVHLRNQSIPQHDKAMTSVQLIRRLTQQDFPNTPLNINSNGEISKR